MKDSVHMDDDDEEKPQIDEIKLAEHFSTIDMHNAGSGVVVEVEADDKNDSNDGNVDEVDRFALSVETKPRLRGKRSFREDSEVSKKVLNLPTDGAAMEGTEVADICSEITRGVYSYKKVDCFPTDHFTPLISFHKIKLFNSLPRPPS